ncbi:MAG: hypothetical protein E7640_03180 [Ruminococcaceae bacterium]|nr:hypothetical protein [Oscillospiraceae bacterium]
MPANIPYKTDKRIIIVSGHFGSGKTCVSVALALALKKAGKNVTVADLDIVNPYFRAADAEDLLTKNGILCINPEFANTNVDIPSLSANIQSIFATADSDRNSVAILDVGGDSGAAALGRFRHEIERIGYDMLFVASKYRPLTENAEMTVENIREIEVYSRLCVSHIVNNSNIGEETTLEYVENSFAYADEICRLSGLPEAFTSVVKRDFCDGLAKKYPTKNFFFIEDTTRKLF